MGTTMLRQSKEDTVMRCLIEACVATLICFAPEDLMKKRATRATFTTLVLVGLALAFSPSVNAGGACGEQTFVVDVLYDANDANAGDCVCDDGTARNAGTPTRRRTSSAPPGRRRRCN